MKLVQPPEWNRKQYGNPEYDGVLSTSSSFAVRGYFKAMRIAGAQARRVLIDAAAAKWGVPADELSTEPERRGAQGHRTAASPTARSRLLPRRRPSCRRSRTRTSKPRRASAYIGKDIPRVEVPLKVTGAANTRIDAQVPGMVYAAVLQSPYQGGAPETVDETRRAPGAGRHRCRQAAGAASA